MPSYSVYGGVLESEVAFDGLPVHDGPPDWIFRVDPSVELGDVAAVVGREQVSPALAITLTRREPGWIVLSYSAYGLGDFRITPDGMEIVWRPGEQPWMEPLRWILFGRVMATALYVGGTVCLHGSAVGIGAGALCFVAPKYHGKSTLAAAMLAAGARLAADDIVPVDPGPPVRIRPGVPVLRLNPDAEAALGPAAGEWLRTDNDVGKTRIDLVDAPDVIRSPIELRAIYRLSPRAVESAPGLAASRVRLDGIEALQALLRHTSITPLLGPAEARLLLSHAAAVVRGVAVYELQTIRDLGRLDEVAAQLRAWHEPEPESEEAARARAQRSATVPAPHRAP